MGYNRGEKVRNRGLGVPYNNVKYYMKKRNISAEELAKRTGIPKSSIYSYMRDNSIPKLEDAVLIADTLYLSVYDLFYREPGLNSLRF